MDDAGLEAADPPEHDFEEGDLLECAFEAAGEAGLHVFTSGRSFIMVFNLFACSLSTSSLFLPCRGCVDLAGDCDFLGEADRLGDGAGRAGRGSKAGRGSLGSRLP